jgi:hypothetical protein
MQSTYNKCPKCNFVPSTLKNWKYEYNERCWAGRQGCDWADTDVKEHMHVSCPVCEYPMGVEGCADYKEKKEAAQKNQWNATSAPEATTARPLSTSRTANTGRVDAGTGWDTECPTCPMAGDNASE